MGLSPEPEELHLPAHYHPFNRRRTSNHITAWTVTAYGNSTMKQNLLQLVIHVLFLWPNSGNGIPRACFQKHNCAFPTKTSHSSTPLLRQFITFCQLNFPSYLSSSTSGQVTRTTSFTGTSYIFTNYLSVA